VVGDDDHRGKPVRDVGYLVEGAPLDPLAHVRDEVVEALVRAFLPANELHDLHIRVCRTLNVFINFFDDEVGFSEVVEAETLTVEPLQGVV